MTTTPTKTLRSYQLDGVNALLGLPGDSHLLADEPGLGKTPQAIEYMNRTLPRSVLVVCPASLRSNWRSELDGWLGYAPASLSVYGYEQLVASGAPRPGFDLVVFDEAHYLKNPKAQRTKAAFAVNASRRLFLTGTPVVNRPMDIYPILSTIDPKIWGSRTEFGKRYCAGKLIPIQWRKGRPSKYAWDFSGASNLDELNRTLRATCMVRRLKRDVLSELPPKTRTVLEIDAPSGEPASLVKAAARMFELNRYRGLSGYDRELEEARKIAFEELSNARLETARRKLPHVVSVAADLLEEEQKLVIFAYHRETIEAICGALSAYSPVKLYGGMSDREKAASIAAFQTGTPRVFVGQLTAAGTGITLTAASTILFAELDWVPGNIIQCEDRCHRFGQPNPVRIFHLVFKDSIDGRMVKALVVKQQTIERTMK